MRDYVLNTDGDFGLKLLQALGFTFSDKVTYINIQIQSNNSGWAFIEKKSGQPMASYPIEVPLVVIKTIITALGFQEDERLLSIIFTFRAGDTAKVKIEKLADNRLESIDWSVFKKVEEVS